MAPCGAFLILPVLLVVTDLEIMVFPGGCLSNIFLSSEPQQPYLWMAKPNHIDFIDNIQPVV